MGLISELMNQCMLEEISANKKMYVGTTKHIKVHPKWFFNLMDDPESRKCVVLDSEGGHRIYGIPLLIDPKVEKWEITI